MADRYKALLIGNSTFPLDPSLQGLEGPVNDVVELCNALANPEVGLFERGAVRILPERTAQDILVELQRFFDDATRDDVLLLYYSGHGLLDTRNHLFLCASDTRTDLLKATAVSNSTINMMINDSAAQTTIIVLDCCHSGAFKGADLTAGLKGNGRFILTSCRGSELANDTDRMNHTSLFTQHFVDGLLRGAADSNGDGFVVLDELYDYMHSRLSTLTPRRPIPQRNFSGAGDVAIARRPHPAAKPPPAPILDLSETVIDLGRVQPNHHLPPRRIVVLNRGGGRLDWSAETTADWLRIECHEGYFTITLRPHPGKNQGDVVVHERVSGATKTVRVRVEVQESAKDRPPRYYPKDETGKFLRLLRGRWQIAASMALLILVVIIAFINLRPEQRSPGRTGIASGECPRSGSGIGIGFFGALTGPNSPQLGINVRNGATLAIDQYKANSPACKVELVEFDSQGDPAQAPALAQKAVADQRVVALIGPAYSGESKVANPIFNEAGLPIVTPSATNPKLAQNGWAIFHRALNNDNAQGPAAAKYIQETLKGRKVAVVDDKSEYGKGIADIVRQKLGSVVAFNDAIDVTAQNYSSTVNGVKSSGVDVIFFGGYYAEGGRLLKQLRDAGVQATFVTDDGAKDDQFIMVAGQSAAEGTYITCPCAPLTGVENDEQFRNAYKQAFNVEPGTYSTEGYDAANVILEAIKAGKTDRNSINQFLGSVDYTGITKRIKFDQTGELSDQKIFMYQVKDGAISPVGLI
jgi:branched-chain amino acid transport system substrate-binding protein